MHPILISLLPLLVPFQAVRPVKCPDCGETLPQCYSPYKRTRRMWLAGGYLCARCGCETNLAGEKVTADTPPAPFPTLHCVMLAVFLLIGVGLVTTLFVVGERTAAPAAIAAPHLVPVLTPPPQEPDAAPVN